ncbi:response regulator [Paraglaciecola hydrolytica]|uniref:Two-component system response regulator n=1 Tax=Paraglaciecola hydrolytica TaxID=1799789 RepID=A0A136A6U1_9ALTE|nr:response regulator [Paraglaciecola hydrolytica]KXI30937.1 two-component system response regulator [Paraglaciecola hydrolytica]
MAHVLLVEDDERLSQLIISYLHTQGFTVTRLASGEKLLATVKQSPPDIVVLDVMLPGDNGFTLCRALRPIYSGPLLFMTAKGDDFDQVMGLEIGADDYIIKPVEPRVLLARINALLRRVKHKTASQANTQKLVFGQLVIDRNARSAVLKGRDVQLTSHEFDMLWKLAENASTLVERSVLYDELIGREYDGLDRSADVRVSRLRKKLDDNPLHPYRIKTIWGKGFFFVADAWND